MVAADVSAVIDEVARLGVTRLERAFELFLKDANEREQRRDERENAHKVLLEETLEKVRASIADQGKRIDKHDAIVRAGKVGFICAAVGAVGGFAIAAVLLMSGASEWVVGILKTLIAIAS